jgi:hypothetical protein
MASYEHAHALVRTHGEAGRTGRPVPLTMDGLIYVTSIVMPDSARRKVPVPALARWLLGLGIAATPAANVAHGLGDGLAGATVAAWPTVALAGSYELLMMITRSAAGPPEQSAQPPRDARLACHDVVMSKTASVSFRERNLWAYDVSLSILLAELINVITDPDPR